MYFSLSDLKSALQSLGMSQTEEETLDEIKKELEDYDEDRRELDEIKNLVARLDLHESRAAKLLFWRVNTMLKRADKVVANLVKKEKELREELVEEGDKEICKEKIVTIQELIEAVTKLQETPNQARVDQIAEVNYLSTVKSRNRAHLHIKAHPVLAPTLRLEICFLAPTSY